MYLDLLLLRIYLPASSLQFRLHRLGPKLCRINTISQVISWSLDATHVHRFSQLERLESRLGIMGEGRQRSPQQFRTINVSSMDGQFGRTTLSFSIRRIATNGFARRPCRSLPWRPSPSSVTLMVGPRSGRKQSRSYKLCELPSRLPRFPSTSSIPRLVLVLSCFPLPLPKP